MSFVLIEVSKLIRSPHIRESGFRNRLESRKFLLVESGIHLKESGIPLMIEIRNLSSTDKLSGIQNLKSGIYCVESIIQYCLGFHYIGAIFMGALFLAYLKRVDVNEFRVKSYAVLSLQTRKPIYFFIFLKF